jgi:hypothetical protein
VARPEPPWCVSARQQRLNKSSWSTSVTRTTARVTPSMLGGSVSAR